MLLQVKAKHFKDTIFSDCEKCAIANAFKEQTGLKCVEYVNQLDCGDENFSHELYDYNIYKNDLVKAKACKFDNTIIREIELTKQIDNVTTT